MISVHVPPFWHGALSHSFNSGIMNNQFVRKKIKIKQLQLNKILQYFISCHLNVLNITIIKYGIKLFIISQCYIFQLDWAEIN